MDMKKILLLFTLLLASSIVTKTEAQSINVNVNIGYQPAWGPVGYDYVNYYYIPEINVYYNVPQSVFYYLDRGRWISARYLPYSYQRYDLYPMYKVVLNDRDPWLRNNFHVRDYARFRSIRNQPIIIHSSNSRYASSRKNTSPWYRPEPNNNNRPQNNIRNPRINNNRHPNSAGDRRDGRNSQQNFPNRPNSGRNNLDTRRNEVSRSKNPHNSKSNRRSYSLKESQNR